MSDRARAFRATAGWSILLLPLAVILLSVALSPASNWTVRLSLAAFSILAIARPDAVLLITIALVGFGTILSHLAGAPLLRVTEVLVVASVAGCCLRAVSRHSESSYHRALTTRVSVPIVLFGAAVVASTIVWLRVYQVQTTYPWEYVSTLLRFLSRDYFFEPRDFAVLVSAGVILEGLALYVAVAALCQLNETFFERAVRMLAIGGAGLAVLSIVRLGEIVLRSPGALDVMRASAAGLRISPQIGDYIAAGSYFALCWVVMLGIATHAARGRVLWILVGLPLIIALYLTGSRSVIGAALAGLATLTLILVRHRAPSVRGVVASALVIVVAMVLTYQWTIGRDVAGPLARQSLTIRAELMRAGLEVIATRPLFGVGLDRFFLVAGGYASPQLRALWQGRMNPHNDFLRFGGELGLVGLGLFLWILAEAARRIWTTLRATNDPRLAGVAAGLIAFLVTSLASNPLMVRDVSYVFWFALGLATGGAARARSVDIPPKHSGFEQAESRNHPTRLPWTIALLFGILIVASIPLRARHEVGSVDLTHVSYGFFEWGHESDGAAARWTGPRATFFVDNRARLVEIPFSSAPPSQIPQQVELRVNGRLADRFTVGPEWRRVRTVLPPSGSSWPHRIDLTISASWVPAEVIPGNQDYRVLGVKVGVVKVVAVGPEPHR